MRTFLSYSLRRLNTNTYCLKIWIVHRKNGMNIFIDICCNALRCLKPSFLFCLKVCYILSFLSLFACIYYQMNTKCIHLLVYCSIEGHAPIRCMSNVEAFAPWGVMQCWGTPRNAFSLSSSRKIHRPVQKGKTGKSKRILQNGRDCPVSIWYNSWNILTFLFFLIIGWETLSRSLSFM